jgi:hypothetical protein
VSQQEVDFSKKINKIKKIDLIFTDVHTDRQKLGNILVNKVVQKLKFSKNDKKTFSKLIFFNEKKNQKDSNDF